MATAPYGVRLLVGAAMTAIEETLKLPQTILMSPMTMASNVAQMVMKVQQDLADLAIKGDAALENLFPPSEEKPDWATFDEDVADAADAPPPGPKGGAGRRTDGRFALYSVGDDGADAARTVGPTARPRSARKTAGKTAQPPSRAASGASPEAPAPSPATAAGTPPIVAELEYDDLTLAQLRARMASLSVADLRALLAYEDSGKSRAPFQTLLANRITRATAK